MDNVQDYWFEGTKIIIVYGDKELFTSHSGCLAENGLIGCNDNKGKIKYYFEASFYDDNSIKKLICHELAHSIISGISLNTEEKIVQDITKNPDACFK